MKKFTVAALLMVLALVAVSAPAQAAVEVSGDVYVGIFDKYMWRGFNLSASQPVAQGGVDISALGFTLSYWTNVQLSNGNNGDVDWLDSNEATETDITIDYTHDFGPVSASVGNIYYTFNSPDAATDELYLSLAGNVLFSPTATVYYDWKLANDENMDGLYYTLGIGHTFDLMEKLSLGIGTTVGYNDESPYVGDYTGWHNHEMSANVDYAFTDQLSASVSYTYSTGLSSDAKELIDSENVLGMTVTFAF